MRTPFPEASLLRALVIASGPLAIIANIMLHRSKCSYKSDGMLKPIDRNPCDFSYLLHTF